MKIGLIGIIRNELEEDYWGTLKKVASLGYEGIEGGIDPKAAVHSKNTSINLIC